MLFLIKIIHFEMYKKIKFLILSLSIFFLSILVIKLLVPDYHLDGGINLGSDRDEIIKKSKEIYKSISIENSNENYRLSFKRNHNLIRTLRDSLKFDKANNILRNNEFSYLWEVDFTGDKKEQINISGNPSESELRNYYNVKLKFSQKGNLIEYNNDFKEKLIKQNLEPDSALAYTQSFIRSISTFIKFDEDTSSVSSDFSFRISKQEYSDKDAYKEYRFYWSNNNKKKQNITLEATLTGNVVRNYEIKYNFESNIKSTENDVYEIVSIVLFVLIVLVLVIIVGLKRLKSYEISFKRGMIPGVVVFLAFAVEQYIEAASNLRTEFLLGILLGGVFIILISVIVWAIGESFCREIWNEKFISIDLLFKKYLLNNKIGGVIVNSIVFGAATTGIVLFVFKFECDYFFINLIKKDFLNPDFLSASFPIFTAFNSAFNSYAIMIVVLLFFISGSIKRFIKDEIAFVILNSLFFSLFFYFGFTPIYLSIFLSFVVGLIISIILVKTDILTTIFSFLIFIFFMKISVFEGNAIYNYKFNEVIIYSLLWMSFGSVLIFRRDKEIDYESLAPKFVENITERQRLKKELEIARIVQAGFLPKSNPALKGMEISSICIPALEVGGDYYDFIKINDNKLGIVIGDVSGKGTQASFYMTLTKGFIKAIAKKSDSPSKVLTEMNELFYENVDRGRFISMIYAIIDIEKKEMKIARAGHNPVLVVETSGNVKLVSPRGLALGLEKGTLFKQVIEEHTETLSKGKTFIFYTDGFSEAMDKNEREFGLERIIEIVNKHSYESSKTLLDILVSEVKKFIGKTQQHDDMTMVVVKMN